MNTWDIVILLAVIGLIAAALLRMRKRKAVGKCSCGCCDGCGGCKAQEQK
ncbi:MAG: FeoB-associated Cys-rich membrane protein [Clostridia bacterium]|nr:FeoB-associated Cys-rich membrane protein [Clostridia bacterium]